MLKTMFVLIFCFFLFGCTNQTNIAMQKKNLNAAAEVNVQLGLGYLQEGQFVRAKSKLLLALTQAPNLVEVQMAMGYFLVTRHEIKQAKKYYEKAIALAPSSGSVQNNYGVYLCEMGKYHDAIQYFELAAQDQNYVNTKKAYYNAAICAKKIPDLALAEKLMKKTK